MKTGFDVFLKSKKGRLNQKKIAYLGNFASVSENLEESLALLIHQTSLNIACVFSPQHGWHGVEQANMIPSRHGSIHDLPLFSLYTNETRKMTQHQLSHFDTLIIDLQDVGCRVYTYLTTVLYVLKSCAENNKSVLVLDRPNPAGRTIEGFTVQSFYQSMVGAWSLPMRYGMTLGEIVKIFSALENLNLELEIITMENYDPNSWPQDRVWIPPSPNMTDVECAQCYSGTVLLEGTRVSEGRGTTSPLKVFGFPGMKSKEILKTMEDLKKEWMKGCILRSCFFKPTFDKFKGEICSAIQIHLDSSRGNFRPFRLMCLFLKSLHHIHPDQDWFLPPPYEYEYKKKPIDILSGDSFLRLWAEDKESNLGDLEAKLIQDEKNWYEKSHSFYLY